MGSILYGQASAIQAQGQVKAKRIATKSGNEKRAAQTDLQLFSQALGNRKIMDAAGKNINAYGENIAKNLEGTTMGAFQDQLRSSEELGATTAMAAAAGIGGSSIEAYNATLETSNNLRLEQSNRQFDRDIYGAGQARGDILTSAVDSLDKNVYRSDIDVSTYMDVKKPSFLGGAAWLGLTAAATYFGGPQAGQAVLAAHDADMYAGRGDYANAASSFNSMIASGTGAFKTYRQTGGNLWSSTKSGANIKG
jgi:hypothetical protein